MYGDTKKLYYRVKWTKLHSLGDKIEQNYSLGGYPDFSYSRSNLDFFLSITMISWISLSQALQ